MVARIDDEITFRKLEILLAFMETGNLARARCCARCPRASARRAR